MKTQQQAAVLSLIHKEPLVDLVYQVGRNVSAVTDAVQNCVASVTSEKSKQFLEEHLGIELLNSLNLNPTNVCNAKCVFCVYPQVANDEGRERAVMSFNLFKRAVDEVAQYGVTSADLTPIVGDPLVDPKIDEKIAYLRQCGFREVNMTTNGILLDKNEFYRRILDAGITHVYISMPACDKDEYFRVYKVDSYEAVRRGLLKLLELNRERGEPAFIRIRFRNALPPSVIMKSEDFKKIIKPFVSEKVSYNFTREYDNWANSVGPEHMVGQMRLKKPRRPINVPCRSLFGCRILTDGTVRLCGCRMKFSEKDDLIVGNIMTESLSAILKSEATRKIIKSFFDGDRPKVCQECTMYSPVTYSWLKNRLKKVPAN